MPGSLMLSGGCHCIAVLVFYFGMPHLWSDEPVHETVVIVDLVAVAQDRNLPKMAPAPKDIRTVSASRLGPPLEVERTHG